ncbi:MAG: T9SS type A sorting domain-containing protein [Ignavibacteriae bacterium]|nr:T9SS type A sorting domain-containing protein [Ignavibacteriota bacterium]
MDEFRFYKRKLDSAEIAATWNQNLGVITGITPVSSIIPNEYSLKQNYPNPFNPVTKISFDLPKSGLVTLKIYDVVGREVKTLVNEVKNAGSYAVQFDGAAFSSGTYFYRLESNNFVSTKKMVLIK